MKKENQKEPKAENHKQKTKRKKKGKIAEVYSLHQKGLKVKQIAEKMKLSERVVRSYIWRAKNPEKYKALLARYHDKLKHKVLVKPDQPASIPYCGSEELTHKPQKGSNGEKKRNS